MSVENPEKTIAVAVSGGADSMALALCLKEWADKTGHKVVGLTVDHGLRPESRQEAEWVKKELAKDGIPHVTLTWEGEKPETRIQEKARRARYGLMAGYCFKNHIRFLAVAHTANDQTETVVMRLLKDSGKKGLAGMSATRNLGRVCLLRPFLKTTRQEIESWLKEKKQEWLEDPSNQKDIYERNRIRKAGIKSGSLDKMIEKFGELREKEEKILKNTLKYKVLSKGILLEAPVSSEGLGYILQKMGKTDYPPGAEKLKTALETERGCTLNHCKIRKRKNGVFVTPEKKQAAAICLEDFDVFTYL